jgi:S1-C subfamily serine protease
MSNYDEIKRIKAEHEKSLFSYKGVLALGIGYKKVGGKATDKLSILVYLNGKKPLNQLEADQILPQKIGVAPIDVIDARPLTEDILRVNDGDVLKDDQSRYRPLVGGIQLYLKENVSGWVGTLGAFVKSADAADSNLYILSNRHVLEKVGLKSFQPDSREGNEVASTTVAETYSNADAAIARMNDPADAKINTIQDIGVVDKIKPLSVNDLGKRVMKRGRTTCLTEGTLESIDTTVHVGGITYSDVATVRADQGKLFSNSGDSGSPVVIEDEEGKKLAGLHFASSQTPGDISIFCKIDIVFQHLNVKLP